MKYNTQNLKRRSRNIITETRERSLTARIIGNMFLDLSTEVEKVYRVLKRRTFILNYVSILISIIALLLSIFKSDDITVDGANLMGVLVGVTSFLVTLLLGFQIYKAIEVEDSIDAKMDAIEERLTETLKTFVDQRIEAEKNNIPKKS